MYLKKVGVTINNQKFRISLLEKGSQTMILVIDKFKICLLRIPHQDNLSCKKANPSSKHCSHNLLLPSANSVALLNMSILKGALQQDANDLSYNNLQSSASTTNVEFLIGTSAVRNTTPRV